MTKATTSPAGPTEEAVNAYANAIIKCDKLRRNDGRPEHDRTTDGMPLEQIDRKQQPKEK